MKNKKLILSILFTLMTVFSMLALTSLNAANNDNNSFAAGSKTGAFIDVNNDLYMWGYNQNFGLGNDSYSIAENTPQKVILPDSEIPDSIYLNNDTKDIGFVVSQSGKLFVFGEYTLNGLADSFTGLVQTPTEIILPENVAVKEVYLAADSTTTETFAFVSTDNELYMWGSNTYGQLGNGTLTAVETPTKVNLNNGSVTELSYNKDFTTVSVITSIGDVYMWGRNTDGEIGLGYVGDNNLSTTEITTPTLVNTMLATGVIESISFVEQLTFYVNDLNEVYVSGSFETYNALFADTVLAADILTPIVFNSVSDLLVQKVFAPESLGLVGFLTTDADLFILGQTSSEYELLNVPTYTAKLEQRYLLDVGSENVINIQSNGDAYLIETDLNFYMLGHFELDGYWNENNLVDDLYYNTPEQIILDVDSDEKVTAADIDSGSGFYLFKTNQNNLFVLGDNYYGQLGTGDFNHRTELTKNVYFDEGTYTDLIQLNDGSSFGGVIMSSPDGVFTIFGLAWYWWTVIGLGVYYFIGTKKGKKIIKRK